MYVYFIFCRVHATLQPALYTKKARWAVLGLLLLPNCLVGLHHHCPCPPARDLGSRVSGLVFLTYSPPMIEPSLVFAGLVEFPDSTFKVAGSKIVTALPFFFRFQILHHWKA